MVHEFESVNAERLRVRQVAPAGGQTSVQGMLGSRYLRPAMVLELQRLVGNQSVSELFDSLQHEPDSRPALTVSRQGDDPPQYPPDWQWGAPTKPVPPDPHVEELPRPPQSPDQGPYRTPGQPTPQSDKPPESDKPTTRERIADALRKAGVPAWAVAGVVVLVVAALADPEPFSKVALIIGSAAAIVFFALIGRGGAAPPGTIASTSAQDTEPATQAPGADYEVA